MFDVSFVHLWFKKRGPPRLPDWSANVSLAGLERKRLACRTGAQASRLPSLSLSATGTVALQSSSRFALRRARMPALQLRSPSSSSCAVHSVHNLISFLRAHQRSTNRIQSFSE